MQRNLFYIVFLTIFLTFGNTLTFAQDGKKPTESFPPKNQTTTTEEKIIAPVEVAKVDIDTNKVNKKKPLLEHKVKRKAVDYEKIDQKKKLITLYNQAEVYYDDIELKAGIIVIDYQKSEVYAGRIKDSTGKYTQLPVFKQGSNVVEPDSIRFNFKTKKTLIWNSVTDQGEFKVKGEVTKKENDSVYFIRNARFTTSKDVNDPEYYFLAKKIKLVPKKKVVTGFANMYIADVPTPIGLPFAFFPMTEKRASGVIIPRYAQTNLRGFAIQNGGYYFAINDYYDLSVLGDYYTNGSYGIRTTTNYALRYKFKGNLNFRYENLLNSERGFPDYSKSTIYNLQWSHAQDSKSNTSSRFSASVNLGSSNYYQQSINQTNAANFLNNSLSSSVSYSKTFATVPQVNMSLTATHTQNTNTKEINMTLPTLQASVDRIFPFAPKNGTKKGFIKNINLQYNLRGENQFKTTDSLFFKPQMFNDAKVGLKHSIPLTTNFKVFKYFSMSAGMNYDEVWYLETIQKNYDPTQNKVVSNKVNGFDAFRQYSFSTSIGTTLYGTFNFKETGKIQSIRHVVRPSVSYAYTPSFERYYDTYLTDANGTYGDYTRFEGGMFGAPGKNLANNVGLSIGNSLEAKVKDKDETSRIIFQDKVGDRVFQSEQDKWGSTASVQYKPSSSFSLTFDAMLGGYDNTEDEYDAAAYSASSRSTLETIHAYDDTTLADYGMVVLTDVSYTATQHEFLSKERINETDFTQYSATMDWLVNGWDINALVGYSGAEKTADYANLKHVAYAPSRTRWTANGGETIKSANPNSIDMYNAADKTPVLVASDSTIDVLTALSNYADKSIKVSPTFTRDGIISVEIPNQDQIVRMEAFDASGKKYFLKNIGQAGNRNQFQLPDATGVFIVRVTTRLGSKSVRVMRL